MSARLAPPVCSQHRPCRCQTVKNVTMGRRETPAPVRTAQHGTCRCNVRKACGLAVFFSVFTSVNAFGKGSVTLDALFILACLWAVCFALIACIFARSRKNHKEQYDTLRELGMLKTSSPVANPVVPVLLGPRPRANARGRRSCGCRSCFCRLCCRHYQATFLSFPEDRVSAEMGLDASLYLSHMKLCAKFWLFHSCTTSLGLMALYQLEGKSIGMEVYAFSYGNLPQGSKWHWVSVACAAWGEFARSEHKRLRVTCFAHQQ